jgi:uncharacterized protein YacL
MKNILFKYRMYINSVFDIVKLFFATLSLDTTILFLTRYADVGGKSLNKWYDMFGLAAVLSDVTVIVIGFLIANFIYPFIFSSYSLPLFLGLVVIVQMIHDIFFYFGVIKPFPSGQNKMMDVFKEYAAENGGKIIFGDAGLMLGSAGFMELYKYLSPIGGGSLAIFTIYCLTYILYTKRQA